jgi:hypothetical protein
MIIKAFAQQDQVFFADPIAAGKDSMQRLQKLALCPCTLEWNLHCVCVGGFQLLYTYLQLLLSLGVHEVICG